MCPAVVLTLSVSVSYAYFLPGGARVASTSERIGARFIFQMMHCWQPSLTKVSIADHERLHYGFIKGLVEMQIAIPSRRVLTQWGRSRPASAA